ncbi:hypothetical protein MMPV_001093 [Pyropia vietnamensis]
MDPPPYRCYDRACTCSACVGDGDLRSAGERVPKKKRTRAGGEAGDWALPPPPEEWEARGAGGSRTDSQGEWGWGGVAAARAQASASQDPVWSAPRGTAVAYQPPPTPPLYPQFGGVTAGSEPPSSSVAVASVVAAAVAGCRGSAAVTTSCVATIRSRLCGRSLAAATHSALGVAVAAVALAAVVLCPPLPLRVVGSTFGDAVAAVANRPSAAALASAASVGSREAVPAAAVPGAGRGSEPWAVSSLVPGSGVAGDPLPSDPPTDDPHDVVTEEAVLDTEVARFTAQQASDDGLVGGGGREHALATPLHTGLEMHALPPLPVGDVTAAGSSVCRSRNVDADGGRSHSGSHSSSPLFGKVTFCRLHGVGVHANGSLLLPAWMASPGTLASLRLCGLPPLTFAPKGAPYPPLSRSLYGSTTRDLFVASPPVREHVPHFFSDMLVALAAPAAFPRLPSWTGDVSCVSHVEAAGGLVAEEGAACSFGGKGGGAPLRLVVAGKDLLLGGFLGTQQGRWVRGLLADLTSGSTPVATPSANAVGFSPVVTPNANALNVQLWRVGQTTGVDAPSPEAAAGRPLPVLYRSVLSTGLPYTCLPAGLYPAGAPFLRALGLPRPRPTTSRPWYDAQPRLRSVVAAAAVVSAAVRPAPTPPSPPCTARVGLLLRPPPRELVNAAQLLGRLRAHPALNVTVLRFDVSGFGRQKAAVADQDVLVGAHGAGLTNGIFLPSGIGELLEVSPWGMVAPPYGALAAAVGVSHTLHFALPDVAGYTGCLRRAAMRLAGTADIGGKEENAPSVDAGVTAAAASAAGNRSALACTALADAYSSAAAKAGIRRAGGGGAPGAGSDGDGGSGRDDGAGAGVTRLGWRIAQPTAGVGCPDAFRCARNRALVVDVAALTVDILAAAGRVCARRRQAVAE